MLVSILLILMKNIDQKPTQQYLHGTLAVIIKPKTLQNTYNILIQTLIVEFSVY